MRRFLVTRFYKAGGRNKLKIKSTEEGQASRHCINKLRERPVRGSSFASPFDSWLSVWLRSMISFSVVRLDKY